jgi:hypothetical protein
VKRAYVPHDVREGGPEWAKFEAALNRYFDAEIRVLEAARDQAVGARP